MEIVTAIITPVVNTLMVPVTNHLRYLISCTQYVQDMRTKLGELDVARLGVEDHINRNKRSHLQVPTQVTGWLEEVEKINAKVKNVPVDVGSCCNLKMRHRLGRKAFKIIKEINSAATKCSLINWTDDPIPLGRVDSVVASTSTPSSVHNDFQSREHIFTEALRALGPNNESHMIALWGMGGVGKTTMMQKLKKAVKEKKMFNIYVEAVIGEKTDPIAIQGAVADYLSIELKESTKPARAEKLRKWFEANSDASKTRVLIILDDVWQFFDMNDIGLSPLPNQGVDFKVLLTSRDRDVCIRMGVEAHSIFNVKVLPKAEAQSFFQQFVKDSNVADLDDPAFHEIGDRIVNRCQGLPIAIKTIAYTLKGNNKQVWEDALARLEHHDIHKVVHEVFNLSYNNLQDEETESIFLLCGLFPEDFNIPKEDLLKYGWGLKLFKRVFTIREARNRLNTCIKRLTNTNLLIQSDNVSCVKMHDLALAFALDMFSKDEHDSFVNHSNILEWPANDMSDSHKRISLTCKLMTEIPRYLKFPKLSILKLMHGGTSLRFPIDFYGGMENLQVISNYKMMYPLFPSSLRCSVNLRVLYLHQCSLTFDCSFIGNLLNLEVLSFANSCIKWLPSAIGNLKKLRLLDLTGCVGLRIDNGVFKDLVKLEEVYMLVADGHRNDISFTEDNCNELAERSKNLSSLEFEFYKNNIQPKSMSFEKLEQFKISVGSYLDVSNKVDAEFSMRWQPHENMLQLITNKDDLLESGMNRLFKKTEVLWLAVDDMNDLEDVEVKSLHPPQSYSFINIRVLVISNCSDLRYLFTLGVAKALSNIERLEVHVCHIMEALVHTNGSEEETITFPKLKVLHLDRLAKFSGLSNNVNIIELPQLLVLALSEIPNFTSIYPRNESGASCILKDEIVIPKLEKLKIYNMENLKEIWPCEYFSTSKRNVSMLREIEVSGCDDVVNLFPSNPMPFFHHLEELRVRSCGSIEVIFNIDLDCVGETEDGSSSRLRVIKVNGLGKLREVWRIKGENKSGIPMIRDFQAVERIWIESCERFRDVFTPTTTNFDLGGVTDIRIEDHNNDMAESSEEEQEEEETSEADATTCTVAFPSYLIPSFHNLHRLTLVGREGVQVVFELKGSSSTELVTTTAHHDDNQQHLLLPYLKELTIGDMYKMTRVWKFSRNDFLMLQKQHSESPFHNLTTISLYRCNSIKYLFSNRMAKLLSNLKTVAVSSCHGIGEVVSNQDDQDEENTTSTSTSTSTSNHTSTTMFPHLDSLILVRLENLNCIDGGFGGAEVANNEISLNNTTTTVVLDQSKISQVGGVSWFLCQYSREIRISRCDALPSVIPSYALAGQTQKLQMLTIENCQSMKEVFETQGININTDVDEGDGGTRAIPRLNNVIIVHKLPNLKMLKIFECDLLEDVFTFSALESLTQLEELIIENCKAMRVIVKEEKHDEAEQTMASSNIVVFPRLKSIQLRNLPDLMGFYLGMNEFQWPSLDKVVIMDCPQMTVFAPGGSTTPQLKYVHTSLGEHRLDCGLNFHVTTIVHQTQFSSLDSTSSCLPASEGKPWSFQNLINLDIKGGAFVEKIIPSSELLQLQKLQTLHVKDCHLAEDVFETLEETNSSFDEPQTTVVKLPNLREMELDYLSHLRYIWRSNQYTVYEFPNLTKVSIDRCDELEHVFTSSMFGSLMKLQELNISNCQSMEVIVKDTNVVEEQEEKSDHGIMNDIMLPNLRFLGLVGLQSLEGFYLGKEDFSFPLLKTLRIMGCPTITTFTMGNPTAPKLEDVETSFGLCDVKEDDLNTFIKTKHKVGICFPGSGMDQLVCRGCHTLLMYIRGAASVQCSCCHNINLAMEGNQEAHVSCGNCKTLLMYPYGARSVKCAVCQFMTSIGAIAGNQVARVSCGNCKTLLMYPYGARFVKCAVCQFITSVGVSTKPISPLS